MCAEPPNSAAQESVYSELQRITRGMEEEQILALRDSCEIPMDVLITDIKENVSVILGFIRRAPKNPRASVDNAARIFNIACRLGALSSHYDACRFVGDTVVCDRHYSEETPAVDSSSSEDEDEDTVVITPPDSPAQAQYTSTDEDGDGLVVDSPQ